MVKNKFKISLAILGIICIFFASFSLATSEDTNSVLDQNRAETSLNTPLESNIDIINHDLYLFDQTITMNESVDGNVFIMGNEVTISGKINGNLYILGNSVKIQSLNENEECYITGSVYLCGNEVYFDAICSDLYAACNSFTGSYNSYIDRDLRIACNDTKFYGLVSRDAYISAEKLSLVSDEDNYTALINGNLDYSCKTKLSLNNSIVNGTITFNQITDESDNLENPKTIFDYIKEIIGSFICTLIIYLLVLWLTPKFEQTSKKYISLKLLPALGIGIASLVLIPIICIILLITLIGIPLSISLILLYIVLIMISFAIVVISVSEFIKGKLTSKKISTDLLILACVNTILYILKLIPYIGGWINFVYMLIGIGIVVMYLFTKNKTVIKNEEKNNEK